MIEFEKYCELYDFIKDKKNLRTDFHGIIYSALTMGMFANAAMCCFTGESAIDFMIDQSDIDTLERIRMDFPEDSRQRARIDSRIFYIKKHGYSDSMLDTEIVTQETTDTFLYIKHWLDKKNFKKESDFYNNAGISRQLFNRGNVNSFV